MPRGDKSEYTQKEGREADHTVEGDEGARANEARRRARAAVKKGTGRSGLTGPEGAALAFARSSIGAGKEGRAIDPAPTWAGSPGHKAIRSLGHVR